MPNWDPASQRKVRDALLVLAATLLDTNRTFGTKDQVDPVRRLIRAASVWAGNPEKDAMYLNVTPSKNDGTTIYKPTSRTCRSVPKDCSRYSSHEAVSLVLTISPLAVKLKEETPSRTSDHQSPNFVQRDNRTKDEIAIDEVERIQL